MKKDTNILVRVNSDLKDQIQKIADENGVSVSSIINYYLINIAKTKKIPYVALQQIKYQENAKQKKIDQDLFLNMLRLALMSCESAPKIKEAYLFGSYARNEQTSNSDIDIHVEFDDSATLLDISGLKIELEKKLHKKVDILSPNEGDSFLELIKKDEKLIYAR